MLPDDTLSTTPVPDAFLPPDHLPRDDLLLDRELGGIALSNPNQGLMVQAWRIWLDGSDVRCAPESLALLGDPGVVLFSADGITELSLTFDQNMRPAVAFVAAGVAKLRWYDSVPGAQVITSFAGATSPRVALDDKRPKQLGASDVLFFYLRDGTLYMRKQRERFAAEHALSEVSPGVSIGRVGMNRGLRLQIELDSAGSGIDLGCTAAYSDLATDTLYAVAGAVVLPLLADEFMPGRWRSRLEVSLRDQAFGWLRVNGELGGEATLRFFGDGALVREATTALRTPMRVPSGRWRRLELEVESTVRCTTITLAGSAQDLRAS